MDAFEVIRTLGRGAFAEVKLIKKKSTGDMFVAKVFHTAMSDLSERERLEIAQEIKLLAHLSHPNIVRFVDNFVEDDRMRIIMEYCSGGSLDRKVMLQEGNLFEEDRIWEYFVQIVAALKYVHSVHVLHRDMKPQNILLTGPQHRVVKLADFGIAKVLSSKTEQAQTLIGTPQFLSPELCAGSKYDAKSDVWALGCIVYELAQLRKPFDGSNMPAIFLSIMRSKPRALPATYSKELRGLVALLLRPRPEDRPSLADLERMPAVEARWKKWRATRRRLMAPLPTPKGVGPAGGRAAGGGGLTSGGSGEDDDDDVPARGREGVLLQVVPQTPSSVRQRLRKEAAELEAKTADEVGLLARQAQAASRVEDAEELQGRLREIVSELMKKGQSFGAGIWEQLGRACADSGAFDEAIQSYRQALSRSSSSNPSSMNTMEQLGNLLVRRAQQVWAKARMGKEQEALEAGRKALVGRNQLMGKHGRRAGAKRRSRGMGRGSRLGMGAGARGGGLSIGGSTSDLESGEPEWKKLAAELMVEGVMHIERLRSLLPTSERCSLLGSAFKRRAWTGLGDSRKKDLQYAAEAYREAWNMELGRAEEEVDRLDAETGGVQGSSEQEEARKDEKLLIRAADDQEDLHMSDSSDSVALEDDEDYGFALSMGGGDGASGAGTGRSSLEEDEEEEEDGEARSKDPVAKQKRRLGRRRERLMLRPNPYARLNQLTLELLAGSGSKRRVARLARRVREAEFFASKKKEREASDVWLWVQVVDARCLRYLIDDGLFDSEQALRDEAGVEAAGGGPGSGRGSARDGASEGAGGGKTEDGPADPRKRPNPLKQAPTLQTVSAGYKEQFVFGATQRVRSSVMDQLGFLEEVLQGRVKEEEEKQPTPRMPPSAARGGHALTDDSMSSLGASGALPATPTPEVGAAPMPQPALPGQVESPRGIAVSKRTASGPSSGAGGGGVMSDWPADPSEAGVGNAPKPPGAGTLALPLGGLSALQGVEGTAGALSARSRRRESTLSWLRALLKKTQALSLLLRRHANQARISLDPTSTPRAGAVEGKTAGFASSDLIDAIPEDREGEDAASSAGPRSPKGFAPVTAGSLDMSAARNSATGRSSDSPTGEGASRRGGPNLRLDIGGAGGGGGSKHHTSDGSSLGGPKLGMLTPHATNHQTAKASALQRGLDAVARLDFVEAARKEASAPAAAGAKPTKGSKGLGGVAGYSGNPFAKSAKRTFVAGGSTMSGSGGGPHSVGGSTMGGTRTQDSIALVAGGSAGGSIAAGSVASRSTAPRNGIGGVSGFSGNPFGRKAKVAFKAGAPAPAPAPAQPRSAVEASGSNGGGEFAPMTAVPGDLLASTQEAVGRTVPGRLTPRGGSSELASDGEASTTGAGGTNHKGTEGKSVVSVSDVETRARGASSRSVVDLNHMGTQDEKQQSSESGSAPAGTGGGGVAAASQGTDAVSLQATPTGVGLFHAGMHALETPKHMAAAGGGEGSSQSKGGGDSARSGVESSSTGSQRHTTQSTDAETAGLRAAADRGQEVTTEGAPAGLSQGSTQGAAGASGQVESVADSKPAGTAEPAASGCACVVS